MYCGQVCSESGFWEDLLALATWLWGTIHLYPFPRREALEPASRFQFDMSLMPKATYLSPRPERALGKVPLEQHPRLKGPGSWAPGPSAYMLHAAPAAKRGYGLRTRADLGLKSC